MPFNKDQEIRELLELIEMRKEKDPLNKSFDRLEKHITEMLKENQDA